MAIDKTLVLDQNTDAIDKPTVAGMKPEVDLSSAEGEMAGEEMMEEVEDDSTRGLPIDRGWAWVVLAGASFYLFLFGGVRRNFGIFFVEFQSRFDSNASVTSLLTTVQNMLLSVGSLFVMTVGVQFVSNRTCIITGSLFLTIANIITAYATNVNYLFISVGVLEGMGMALIHPPVTAAIGEYFNKRRAMANGIAFSGASMGGLVFAPIMSSLFENYGYSGTLLIVAGMVFNICITGCLLRPINRFAQRLPKGQQTNGNNVNGGDQKTNGAVTKVEKELLISNDSLVISNNPKQSTDDIILHIVKQNGHDKSDALVNRSVLQLRTNGLPKFVRSGSQEPDVHNGSTSPLLSPTRAISLENIRRRTTSQGSEFSGNKPMNSRVESLSRSRVELYASSDCVCASVVDIREIHSADTEGDDGDSPAKQDCCSKLKSSFDLTLFKNPVFPVFLVMAGLFASSCMLTPSFLVPHTKDVGLSIEQGGLLMSVVAGCGLTSRLLCGLFADRKCINLTTLLGCTAILMGLIAHSLRFFSSFGSFIAIGVIIGLCCDIYQAMYAVVLVEYLTFPRLKSCIGFAILCHGFCNASTLYLVGLLRDSTGSYLASYHLLGTMAMVGGCLSLSLPHIHRWHQNKLAKTVAEVDV